jgi:hypothetical protein
VTGLLPRRRLPSQARIPARSPLELLRWNWGSAYEIEECRARRRDGLGGWFEAQTPDELDELIQADYTVRPVPREIAP